MRTCESVGDCRGGYEGFNYIKARVLGFVKSYAPPKEVSRTRYVIGLLMFAAPIMFGWASTARG